MLILIAVLSLCLIYLFGFRKSVLGISLRNSQFAGILLAKELFLLILLGVVLLEFFDVENFYALHYVEAASVELISWLILYTVFAFLLTLLFMQKYIFPKYFHLSKASILNPFSLHKLYYFTLYLFVAYGACLILMFNFWGHHHAFFSAIFEGASLKQIRMANKYESSVPSVFISFVNFLSVLLAILAGSSVFKRKVFQRLIFLCASLIFASSSGEKAPLLNVFALFFLSCASFSHKRFGFRLIFGSLVLALMLSFLAFYAVSIQYPDYTLDEYVIYFINRIGVGQISGVYEQFNLLLYKPEYIFHAIPFGNFFAEYVPFQKDLMLVSEDVKNATSTGVKNSLFLSEAMGIGGWGLAIASPFIVAVNYALSYVVIYKIFNYMLLNDKYLCSKICPLLFIYIAPLTGGFSEWLFFKLLIIYVVFILVILLPFNLISSLSRVYPRNKFRNASLS